MTTDSTSNVDIATFESRGGLPLLSLPLYVTPFDTGFPELFEFEEIVEFVLDFLELEDGDMVDGYPKKVKHIWDTLSERRGTVLDICVVIVSFLRGVGYDGFCVSGRGLVASLEHHDLVRNEIEDDLCKYSQGLSKHQISLNYGVKRCLFALNQIGWWVMIQGGKRGIKDSIMINPLTGCQFDRNSIQEISCVFSDMFIYMPLNGRHLSIDFSDYKCTPCARDHAVKIPNSKLELSKDVLLSRFSSGIRTRIFGKSTMYQFSPFKMDGLSAKTIRFMNFGKSAVDYVFETYMGRPDCLQHRLKDGTSRIEQFESVVNRRLDKVYRAKVGIREHSREIQYIDGSRSDGLVQLKELLVSDAHSSSAVYKIIGSFKDRSDSLEQFSCNLSWEGKDLTDLTIFFRSCVSDQVSIEDLDPPLARLGKLYRLVQVHDGNILATGHDGRKTILGPSLELVKDAELALFFLILEWYRELVTFFDKRQTESIGSTGLNETFSSAPHLDVPVTTYIEKRVS